MRTNFWTCCWFTIAKIIKLHCFLFTLVRCNIISYKKSTSNLTFSHRPQSWSSSLPDCHLRRRPWLPRRWWRHRTRRCWRRSCSQGWTPRWRWDRIVLRTGRILPRTEESGRRKRCSESGTSDVASLKTIVRIKDNNKYITYNITYSNTAENNLPNILWTLLKAVFLNEILFGQFKL